MKGIMWLFREPDLPECHIIRGLAAAGRPQLVFMCPTANPPADLSVEHVEVCRLKVKSLLDPMTITIIRAALSSGLYGAVYASDTKPLANVVWAALGLPVAVIAYRGTCSLKRLDPVSWMTYLSPRIDRLVCVSDAVLDFLASTGVAVHKLERIYKGHDPNWYKKGSRAWLMEIGVPESSFVVGCAADMRPLKGVYEMLLSLEYFPADHPVRFLLAGRVRDPRIQRLVEKEPFRSRVHLLGHRNDAPSWMGVCNAFAMPTLRAEGLPKAVIEAMCMDVVPIVTDVGGMPELFKNGVSGIVIRPDDPQAMAHAIQHLYENPKKAALMGARAHQRINNDFHITKTICDYSDLLDELEAEHLPMSFEKGEALRQHNLSVYGRHRSAQV